MGINDINFYFSFFSKDNTMLGIEYQLHNMEDYGLKGKVHIFKIGIVFARIIVNLDIG